MTKYLGILVVLLSLMPIGSSAEQATKPPVSGHTSSYPANQGYIQRSYPQGFDQEYRMPTQHGSQYYQQEPEGAIGYYGNQRTARDENPSYSEQFYYYY